MREFTSVNAPPPSAASTNAFPDLPAEPTSIAESGLGMGFLTDLVLKVVYFYGNITGQQLSEVTKLPYLNVLDKVLEFLKLEEYIDIIGTQGGFSERSFQYVLGTKGRLKVNEVLDRSQYAGPAPVPLASYIAMVNRQAVGEMIVNSRVVRDGFNGLVISDRMLDKIGPAANSARSLFLYGPPGNGKTTIAEGIANMLGGLCVDPLHGRDRWPDHQGIRPAQPPASSCATASRARADRAVRYRA